MKLILLLSTILFSTCAMADIAVIVNKDNTNIVTQFDVRRLYLSKEKFFANGEKVRTFNYEGDKASTDLFNNKVLNKNGSRLNSYWARMLFSSKGAPPMNLESAEELKRRVAADEGALGFIPVKDVDDSVRTLFIVK